VIAIATDGDEDIQHHADDVIYADELSKDALLTFTRLLPYALLSPISGMLVDRWDRKGTMVIANLVLTFAILPLALVRSADDVWIVYLVAFTESLVARFLRPAEGAMLPRLVDEIDVELDGGQALARRARVAEYAGLIFATWDAAAASLDDYLGDVRWYIDFYVKRADMEVFGPPHRWEIPSNWKIPAENFASDAYHTGHLHASISRLGLVPTARAAKVGETGVAWNYTTYLNIVFIIVAAALVVRFFRSGGMSMLRMMGGGPEAAGAEQDAQDAQGGHAAHGDHAAPHGVTDL